MKNNGDTPAEEEDDVIEETSRRKRNTFTAYSHSCSTGDEYVRQLYIQSEEEDDNQSSRPQDADQNNQSGQKLDPFFSHRMSDERRQQINEHDMSRVIADAGVHVYGCIFSEVWVLNEDNTRLIRPQGGAWMDPAFRLSLPSEDLISEAGDLFSEACDTAIGVGLVGNLFREKNSQKKVQWRQLKSIVNDPFKQKDGRTQKIYSLGIKTVGYTTFSFGVDSGILLFYMRSTVGDSDITRVMLEYTDLVGSTFAMIKTRNQCAESRKQVLEHAKRKLRAQLVKKYSRGGALLDQLGSKVLDKESMARLKATIETDDDQDSNDDKIFICQWAKRMERKICNSYNIASVRIKNSPKKWSGGGLHGPPRHTLSSSVLTFSMCFLAMLMVLKISNTIGQDRLFAFDGGWYSSTLCILFALTPAPVGQPRQIIAAHLLNMLVGILTRLIPISGANGMPLIYKQALSVALGVSGQAYLGMLHPPATSLSFAFVTSVKWSWGTMAAILMTDLAVIVFSVLIVNLSENGQYPLFWFGFGWEVTEGVSKVTSGVSKQADKLTEEVSKRASYMKQAPAQVVLSRKSSKEDSVTRSHNSSGECKRNDESV